MRTVLPLAGPDFVSEAFGVRPLHPVDGEPLLQRILRSRPWTADADPRELCFVLRETPETPAFRGWLEATYPGSQAVTLSSVTQGAIQSALAGAAAAVQDPSEPICVDLADILFEVDWPMLRDRLGRASAVAPYFSNDGPEYSYLQLGEEDRVIRTAEKEVISSHASAGVYFFAHAGALIAAAEYAHCAWRRGEPRALFVCPALNGLIERQELVLGLPVTQVRPVGKLFHSSDQSA